MNSSSRFSHLISSTVRKFLGVALVAVSVVMTPCAQAVVTLPYYDGFDYTEGNLNTVGSPEWFAGSGTTTLEIAVTNPAALTAPPGFVASSAKGVRRAPSGSSRRSVLQFNSVPATDGNTLYVSFLLDVQTAPGGAQIITHLNDTSSSDGSPQAGVFVDNGPKVGIGKNTTTPGFTMPTNLGAGAHLVVVRYTFQSGNDQVDLWVDPPASEYGAATAPASLGSVSAGSDPSSLDYLQIVTPGSSGGVQFIDELRLGTSWADVTTAGVIPVAEKLGFTSQPENAVAGETLNSVVVQVQTAGGASVASNNVPVTLALTSGSGTLNGTLTRNTDATGKAVFDDLSIGTTGAGKQLTATASGIGAGLTAAVSGTFTITAPPPVGGPVITQTILNGGNVILRGSNGPVDDAFQILSATNTSLPMYQWTLVGTDNFDIAGNFDTTNPAPADMGQQFFRLLVGTNPPPTPSAPSITTPPANQLVAEGQSATFSVTATGTAPLYYQWYYNTNTPITGENSASLVITNVGTNNEGAYSVIVTNSLGSATSSVALLLIDNSPAFNQVGFSTLNGGTTGGAGGPTVTVSNFASFDQYARVLPGPHVIRVQGTINLGTSNARVRSNKTIIGVGNDATLVGNLKVFGETNIIIRNITFTNPNKVGDGDGLTFDDAQNVWVDHCTFVDCGDGSLDITHGSDWVTVSWCKFYYTFNSGHNFANLIGHSDSGSAEAEDTGKLRVTMHHNWWSTLCIERMPRVRFGKVHVFNNYFYSPGNNYCIRAARDCEVLVENNYFRDVKNVWELYVTEGLDGKVYATNNIQVNTTWSTGDSKSFQIPGTDSVFSPAYSYTPDPEASVPNLLTNWAGAGIINF